MTVDLFLLHQISVYVSLCHRTTIVVKQFRCCDFVRNTYSVKRKSWFDCCSPKLISNKVNWVSRVYSGSHKGPGMRVQNVAQHCRVTQGCEIRVFQFACPYPRVSKSFQLKTRLMHLILNNIPEWLHDWVLTALTSIHKRKKYIRHGWKE